MPFVSNKTLEEFKQASTRMNEELKKLEKKPYLVSIERVGRKNQFTFIKDGKTYVIESMGLLSDNISQWKEDLLK